MARRITREEHAFIVANAATMTYTELGEHLGRTASTIRQYCYNHGIVYANRKRRDEYSDAERAFIINNPHLTAQQIAKHLGRSRDAILLFVRKNNLTVHKRPPARRWTEDDIHYVRELALTMNGKEIAEQLDRTYEAILTICRRYNIPLRGRR